jgi:hypothetical protein
MASTVSTSSAFIAGAVVSDQPLFFEALRDPGYAVRVHVRSGRRGVRVNALVLGPIETPPKRDPR